jgi:diacylglycerol kinase (ATP)
MAGLVADSLIVSPQCPAAIFVNEMAGGGRAHAHLALIKKTLEHSEFPAEFFASKTRAEMQTYVRSAIANGRQLLVAMGGDGTVQELVNMAFAANVTLGVLPVGGGNDFAAALNIPKNPVEAAQVLVQGRGRLVDVLRARTADGRERLYVGGGGMGLDAEAARYANETFHRVPGRLRYVASALRALWGFKPIVVRAQFPGSSLPDIETLALLAAVLNAPTYGAGVRLAPEAMADDGTLNAVLVEVLSATEVMRLLPRLLLRGDLQTNRIKRFQAKRVILSTESPCMFHGDGEILGPAPAEIEVLPNSIRVLTTRRKGAAA